MLVLLILIIFIIIVIFYLILKTGGFLLDGLTSLINRIFTLNFSEFSNSEINEKKIISVLKTIQSCTKLLLFNNNAPDKSGVFVFLNSSAESRRRSLCSPFFVHSAVSECRRSFIRYSILYNTLSDAHHCHGDKLPRTSSGRTSSVS